MPNADETKFVKGGKAEVQIQFSAKTSEAMEKLKTLGFEAISEKGKDAVVGRIGVGKIADLAEIAEIRYVLPKTK